LACPWCSNPESINPYPEVAHVGAVCKQCGSCIQVCDLKVISFAEKGIRIDREKCNNCGKCVEACINDALKLFGKEVSVEEVLEEAIKDKLYYHSSDGGVTASGGEPLRQARFVSALFERCHEEGLHTTLDTSGHGRQSDMEMVLENTDLVLFDLKVIDPGAHIAAVKASNDPIHRNARLVVERGVPMIVRIPLIPGLTDTDENLEAVGNFVEDLNPELPVNILPYHRMGMGKYRMLDREYELGDLTQQPREKLEAIVGYFESRRLVCDIVV
ncbi:glycyl-radical enzyme activating protein, partial [Chloroflexota bacterium]